MLNLSPNCLRRLGVALIGGVLAASLAPAPASAAPSLVIEVDSGKVLLAEDATKPWYQASVTKLMTAYVTFKAVRAGRLTMQTLIPVTERAAAEQPSKMGFKPGTMLTVDNALKMVLVKSANDIAVTVAEGVSGNLPAFVAEMNAAARELGMDGTSYDNPNGLPSPGQISTARDLAILARAIYTEFPEHADIFRIPSIKLGNSVIRNYNRLLDRYPGADGMKTGFVCSSGFNLVASAERGGKRVLAVVLGTSSGRERTEKAALLLEKGFQHSWKIFGAVAPTVTSLRNEGGPPVDMRAEVCGGKRKTVASEADDTPVDNASSFVAAGMGDLGDKVTGASLLQNLPPSMPPVEVWVGPVPDAAALAAAYPVAPKKEKPAAKNASKNSGRKTATFEPSAPRPPKPPARPAAKPAAKPAAPSASAYPTVPLPPVQ